MVDTSPKESIDTTRRIAEAVPSLNAPEQVDADEHTESSDVLVEEIRRIYGTDQSVLFPHLEDVIRRRLGMAPPSAGVSLLGGLTGSGIRLGLALLATALAGRWAEIPWGRWAAILVFFFIFDAWNLLMARPLPWVSRVLDDWTALLPTIVRESDLHDLLHFTRRAQRPAVSAAAGIAVAATMLLASSLFAPDAIGELPIGSIVLLVLLLHDFGTFLVFGGVFGTRALVSRVARYDHHLFWPSPADSPEFRKSMRMTTNQAFGAGAWITTYLLLTAVLVGWDSALVVPLALGFIVIGYLTSFIAAVGNRASLRKIVERIREQRLGELQARIDSYGPGFAEMSSEDLERLRGLIELHNMIRDAPSAPPATHTLLRTAAGLIIPTIVFVLTVFGEVSAERLLDRLLP